MEQNEKIKVVRIITRLNIGGPTIHAINLNAGLNSDRFEQVLVHGSELADEGSLHRHGMDKGVKMICVPEMGPAYSLGIQEFKALLKIYQLIKREKPYIVHTHTAKAGFLGVLAARLAGVPLVFHTYHGHILHSYFGPVKNFLLRCMSKFMALLTDRIIAISERIKDDLINLKICNPKKIVLVPLGLDLKPFETCKAKRGIFHKKAGLLGKHFVIGIVGRIYPVKNHHLFIEAAALISREVHEAHFAVVGDGALRKQEEAHAEALGIAKKVFFAGWQSDLPSLYADLDMLVVSSNNEGTPVSAIEAMSSGTVVVSTMVGGIPDLITHNVSGVLVPPKDAKALADAVISVIKNEEWRRRMEEEARKQVVEKYSVERLLKDIEDLYLESVRERMTGKVS